MARQTTDTGRTALVLGATGGVGGDDVVATFSAAGDAHGWPAATLTDNGELEAITQEWLSDFTGAPVITVE